MLNYPDYAFIEFDDRPLGAMPAAKVDLCREHEKKKADFNTAFTLLLQLEIHPALERFLDQVRDQGHSLEVDASVHQKFDNFLHRSFSVRLKGRPHPVVFTFAGNCHHRKVFVYTEYNASTTINVYDPAQINEPLLETIMLKGLRKIVHAA